ncbi:tetratricopeptide (TPR) repeat protein/DNA-binding CsgD family transcriptional regulator [Flavobacterium gossypii]|uniref:Tetratricopeptide (TPR) repeat protein/DNA-binding CsgD family transcriptional regulator n=1 Tax=Flavobacterium gossypii TaxID=1646119 RepID=A0ABR6DP67_9FLAO|nr:tetratricopeptide repeat protein [Flavobacterium gossypii]MBA9073492.1 tetratricopeptide (TPR) repeat protein/DNA-binding CsgD family transcriptional regulator [Flavobacterium gossypii]
MKILLCFFTCNCFFILLNAQTNSEIHKVQKLLNAIEKVQETDGNKALNYLEEAFIFEKKIPDSLLIRLYDTAGGLYDSQGIYDLSLDYYHLELLLQKRINTQNRYATIKEIGNVYYKLGNESKARKYWASALEGFKKAKNPKTYLLYNNFAILEEKQGNLVEAKKIYTTALKSTLQMNDPESTVMSYQNLGIVNFKLNQFEEALYYFFKAKSLATRLNEQYSLVNTYYNLGYFYYNYPQKNIDSAKYYLNKAFSLSSQTNYVGIKKESSESLIKIYEGEQNYQLANFYLHQIKDANEKELGKIRDVRINQVEFKYRQKLKEEAVLAQQKKKNWMYFAGLSILTLGCVILFLIYKLQKSKLMRSKLEKELLLEELDGQKNEINQKSLEILHSHEILDSTHKKLQDLIDGSEFKPELNSILIDLKNSQKILNKEEYEKLFKENQIDFYKKLISRCPSLTINDLKLSAFLRLNLSTKDISVITGQSQNSINIGRHRLRKKLKIEDQQNLISFLIQL